VQKRKNKEQTKILLYHKSSSFQNSAQVQVCFQKFGRKICSNKYFVVPAWNNWVVLLLKSLFPTIVFVSH